MTGLLLAGMLLAGAGSLPAPVTPAEAPAPALPAGLPDGWYASVETTLGSFVARLLPDQAPQAVAHFAAMAEGRMSWIDPLTGETKTGRYYDGLKVHLSLAAQRFEAGDPTETGRGAPPIYIPLEAKGPVSFDLPWRMGMTRASLGRISGVLFFVTATPLKFLNPFHPCFGEVISGREVVQAICGVKTDPRGKPLEPIVLEHVRVVKVGNPEPLPEPVTYKPKLVKFGPKDMPSPK